MTPTKPKTTAMATAMMIAIAITIAMATTKATAIAIIIAIAITITTLTPLVAKSSFEDTHEYFNKYLKAPEFKDTTQNDESKDPPCKSCEQKGEHCFTFDCLTCQTKHPICQLSTELLCHKCEKIYYFSKPGCVLCEKEQFLLIGKNHCGDCQKLMAIRASLLAIIVLFIALVC